MLTRWNKETATKGDLTLTLLSHNIQSPVIDTTVDRLESNRMYSQNVNTECNDSKNHYEWLYEGDITFWDGATYHIQYSYFGDIYEWYQICEANAEDAEYNSPW